MSRLIQHEGKTWRVETTGISSIVDGREHFGVWFIEDPIGEKRVGRLWTMPEQATHEDLKAAFIASDKV